MRTFTTDGPCDATLHYVLPAAPRLAEARSLVDRGAYFIVRAPVRTGKTTALRALAAEITAEGRYAALLCSSKVAASAGSDLAQAQEALLSALRLAAEQDLPAELRPPVFPPSANLTLLWEGLSAWARVCPRPIVLFFDDTATLHPVVLESLFRQLEAGFSRRPGFFPWSIGLVTSFDLRPKGLSKEIEAGTPDSTGPFERFWSSRLLPPFSTDEIRALYAQHFGDLQQRFAPEAPELIQEITAGHPYWVQALGRSLAEVSSSDEPLTKSHVLAARRQLIQQNVTPIADLEVRLDEPRVRHVVEALLQGTVAISSVSDADVQFVRDLGLISADDPVRIEGTLHQALIPRLLARNALRAMTDDPAACFDEQGQFVMERCLQHFAAFYTAHAAELLPAMPYSKIAPELILLGYLWRMLEGRGFIELEFGASRGRIEVTMTIPGRENAAMNFPEQREVLVLIPRRKGDSGFKKRGFEWLEAALRRASSSSGTLVIMDKRDKRSPGKRVKLREVALVEGLTVRSLRI